MTRARRVILLVRCVIQRVFFGSARKKTQTYNTVCIIQKAQLGDMVCTTPMFRALKKYNPHTRVIVIGTSTNELLLSGHIDVDEYVCWQDDVENMARRIADMHCDAVCVTVPDFTGLAAAYMSRVPTICSPYTVEGWCPVETRSYTFLRRLVAISVPHYFTRYAPREYLRLLEPLGVYSETTEKSLAYSAGAALDVDALLRRAGVLQGTSFVCVVPGAGNKIKSWPPERFAAVIDHIVHTYNLDVLVLGSVVDQQEVADTLRHVQHARVHNLVAKTSLEELKACIARSVLLVGVDTGSIYVAEAFGVPTIDIVGPVSEKVQPPRGGKHIVLVPKREKPQLFILNARVYDEVEARRQAEATTAAEVCAAVDVLLGKNHENSTTTR